MEMTQCKTAQCKGWCHWCNPSTMSHVTWRHAVWPVSKHTCVCVQDTFFHSALDSGCIFIEYQFHLQQSSTSVSFAGNPTPTPGNAGSACIGGEIIADLEIQSRMTHSSSDLAGCVWTGLSQDLLQGNQCLYLNLASPTSIMSCRVIGIIKMTK